MSVRAILRRTAPAMALAIVAAGIGAGGSASPAVAAPPSAVSPLAWFFYAQYPSQIACLANIAPAILTTHADNAQCVNAGGGKWNLILYYG